MTRFIKVLVIIPGFLAEAPWWYHRRHSLSHTLTENHHDHAVPYMLWDTPGGLNQIARLRLKDVDLDNGSVLVMGKGRRERWMPIGDTAAEGDRLSTPEESRHSFASFWTRWLAVSMP